MAAVREPKVSPEEYLEAERKAEFKHEYLDGYVYAMAGARMAHIRICGNLSAVFRSLLKGRDCDILSNDMRVAVPSRSLYSYPDVVIVCGKPELLDDQMDTLLNPLVIFEVLSPSTEAWDRGVKFARYATIPTLAEYVLVSTDRARVERFRRQGEEWVLTIFEGPDATMSLSSVEGSAPLSDIYERVEFEESSKPTGQPR